MKFEEVIQALRDGKKIRRLSWSPGRFLIHERVDITDEDGDTYEFDDLILDDNWDITKEKVKKYQVLFKNSSGNFTLSNDKYSTISEFNHKHCHCGTRMSVFSGDDRSVVCLKGIELVKETEEEFDV